MLAWRNRIYGREDPPAVVSIVVAAVTDRQETEYSLDVHPKSRRRKLSNCLSPSLSEPSHVPLLQAYLDLRTRSLCLRHFLPQRRPHPNTLRSPRDLAESIDGGGLWRLLCSYSCRDTKVEGESSEEDRVKYSRCAPWDLCHGS